EKFATIPVGVRTHLRNFLRANGVYVPLIQGKTSVSQALESVVHCPEPLQWPDWEVRRMSARGLFNSFLNTADPVETERRNRMYMEEAFQKRDFDLVRLYQSRLGIPLMQRLPHEGPAPQGKPVHQDGPVHQSGPVHQGRPVYQGRPVQQNKPGLPPSVSVERSTERTGTRERRAPVYRALPPTRRPGLVQTPLPPRETRMVLPVRQQPVQPVQPEPEQPELLPSVTTRQERTRERRAPVLETPSLAPETTSQAPERALSLAPLPASPRE